MQAFLVGTQTCHRHPWALGSGLGCLSLAARLTPSVVQSSAAVASRPYQLSLRLLSLEEVSGSLAACCFLFSVSQSCSHLADSPPSPVHCSPRHAPDESTDSSRSTDSSGQYIQGCVNLLHEMLFRAGPNHWFRLDLSLLLWQLPGVCSAHTLCIACILPSAQPHQCATHTWKAAKLDEGR